MKKRFLLNLLGLFLFFACNTVEENKLNKNFQFENKYTLEKISEIRFPLDSLTAYGSLCKQFFVKGTEKILAFHNANQNSIYFYDFSKKNIKKIITLNTEGADGVGFFEGFLIHNLDSIFIPSNTNQAIYLINDKGVILNKYPYSTKRDEIFQIRFLENRQAVFFKNELLCPSNLIGGTDNGKVMRILNLTNKTWKSAIQLPNSYKKGFFGAINFYTPYSTFNYETQKIIYSFPIDDYVYDYAISRLDTGNKIYAGSKDAKMINPVGNNPFFISFNKRQMYFAKSYSYLNIIYDPHTKFYFRLAEHPINDEHLKSSDPLKRGHKNYSIIIINEKLEKVGEYTPDDYTYGQDITPTPDGLLFLNFKKSKQDENHVYYDIFKVVKKDAK